MYLCIVFLLVSQIKMNNNTYDFPIAERMDRFFCIRYHNPYFTQFPFNKHFRSICKGLNKRFGYRMHLPYFTKPFHIFFYFNTSLLKFKMCSGENVVFP